MKLKHTTVLESLPCEPFRNGRLRNDHCYETGELVEVGRSKAGAVHSVVTTLLIFTIQDVTRVWVAGAVRDMELLLHRGMLNVELGSPTRD